MIAADTAWIMVATALVLFMTLPGLALFYGGLVHSRNVLSVFMHCFVIACVMSLLWFIAGYSIAFGDGNALWGGLNKAFLWNVTPDSLVGTLPENLFFLFQMTFAIITPALIVGAYVERVGFWFVVLFSSLWLLLCYAPVAHWVWGGGFLADGGLFGAVGVKDFAGGIVVHETAGIAALVIAFVLGRRKHVRGRHNSSLTLAGAGMLWVGWYGFNGGSQLAADSGAVTAMMVTHLSAAAGSVTWALWDQMRTGKTNPIGLVTGTIAGLAAITPASGFVGPIQALIIGAASGVICNLAVDVIQKRFDIDDSLDVFAVHGVAGIFGTLMIAVFGKGNWIAQLGAVVIVGIFTFVITCIIIRLTRLVTPIRIDEEGEEKGLDITSHGDKAYIA